MQKRYLKKHLSLAKELSLPVIIHTRDAFSDLFDICKDFLPFNAVLHCFTGKEKEAKKVLDNGWFISFSGIITFPKSSISLQNIAANTPLEKMLIETDSPFLAPQKYRGKKNEPAYLIEIAQKIADLKKIPLEDIIKATSENAKKLFSI